MEIFLLKKEKKEIHLPYKFLLTYPLNTSNDLDYTSMQYRELYYLIPHYCNNSIINQLSNIGFAHYISVIILSSTIINYYHCCALLSTTVIVAYLYQLRATHPDPHGPTYL